MNRATDNERLFTDALAEAGPVDFRESLLGETLHLVRRRQRLRRMRRAGIVAGIAVALALSLWPRATSRRQNSVPAVTCYRLIETQPLSASEIVTTQPFTSSIVVSAPAPSIFTTADVGDGLRLVNDDELLSLAPAPAVLVRLGPNSAELILDNQNKPDVQ